MKAHGPVDTHEQGAPGEQAHSWIGRTGDGYRFDYFHVGREVAGRVRTCAYLLETRERRLTDHAAVTLSLSADAVRRLDVTNPAKDDAMLF